MDGLTIRNGMSAITGSKVGGASSKSDSMGSAASGLEGASDIGGGKSFADTLKDAVGQVNTLQKDSDKQAQMLATGKTTDIPQVMMSAEKADIALRLMVQVRNKVIDAYNDVMKMPV